MFLNLVITHNQTYVNTDFKKTYYNFEFFIKFVAKI